MWGVVPSDRHDWAKLREDIKKYVMVFICSLSAIELKYVFRDNFKHNTMLFSSVKQKLIFEN